MAKRESWLEDVWPRFGKNTAAYDALTFRELPIVLAAQNDAMLEHLLRRRLVDDERVLGARFKPHQALGDRSNRLDVAYLVGLVDADAREILRITSQVRNHFAHVATASSADPKVRNLVDALASRLLAYARTVGYTASTPGFEGIVADQRRRAQDGEKAAGGLLIAGSVLVQIYAEASQAWTPRLRYVHEGSQATFSAPPSP